jgi:beta-lactam-binding protein with PASTA domain
VSDSQERPARPPILLSVVVLAVCVVLALGVGLVIYMVALAPAIVPDVQLEPADKAAQLIQNAGLEVGTTGRVATDSVGPGLVTRQSPPPLAQVRGRSAVDLEVAVTPTSAIVPRLAGLEATAASEELAAELFVPRRIDVFETSWTVGTVVAQIPVEESQWVTGRPVGFAVAIGPDDGTGVSVPDVVGKQAASALTALYAVPLMGYGFLTDPEQAATSVVTRQLPGAGLKVRPGTTVMLLLEPK